MLNKMIRIICDVRVSTSTHSTEWFIENEQKTEINKYFAQRYFGLLYIHPLHNYNVFILNLNCLLGLRWNIKQTISIDK